MPSSQWSLFRIRQCADQRANDHITHKWQADMIVLGNSAKNLLRRRVLGETALHAIRESTLPLFLSQ